jgi:hypothetical protein
VVEIGQAQHVLGRTLAAGFSWHGGGLPEPPRNDRPPEDRPSAVPRSRELTLNPVLQAVAAIDCVNPGSNDQIFRLLDLPIVLIRWRSVSQRIPPRAHADLIIPPGGLLA